MAHDSLDKNDVVMIDNATNRDDLEENLEKAPQVFHVDGFNVLGLSAEDAEFYQNYSEEEKKRTKHKVSLARALWREYVVDAGANTTTCRSTSDSFQCSLLSTSSPISIVRTSATQR